MASELAISASMKFSKGSSEPLLAMLNKVFDVSGTQFQMMRQSVGTSEEAINLGEVATGGWFFAINRAAANFVSIRQATGGTNFIRLNVGEFCLFRIHASSAAPFWISDTASSEVEFLLIPA